MCRTHRTATAWCPVGRARSTSLLRGPGGCQPSLAVVAATRPRTSPHAGEEGGSGTENGGLESFPISPVIAQDPSLSSRPQAMLAYNPKNMTEDEREHLLSTVGQAHAGLSEVALKLRLGLPPKTSVLKTAIKAERVAFDLKRSLQRLEVKDVETITRRAPVLPEVRRGGKVVDPESLLRHENRHDERLTGLPRRNTPRRSG